MRSEQIAGTVTDSQGAVSPFTGTIDVVDPPVIASVTVTPSPVAVGQTATITVAATDPQGDTLTYTCTVNGVPVTAPDPSKPNVFTWVAA